MSERTPQARATRKRNAGKRDTLQRRLDEALAREAASAEILASIRSSGESAQPVLDAIVRNLQRLFGTAFAAVFLARDGKVEIAAAAGKARFVAGMRAGGPMRLEDEEMLAVRAMRRAQVLRLCPVIGNPTRRPRPSAWRGRPASTRSSPRRCCATASRSAPSLLRGTEAVPFDDAQVALIQSFADQAVIAIENARLFNETKEALEQQTATAEILRVMSSSPSDVQPVFDAVARKTSELCNGDYAIVVRFDGELLHLAAEHNARPGSSAPTAQQYPRRPGRDTPSARAVLERAVVHIPHAGQGSRPVAGTRSPHRAGSFLSVPLMREGRPIGAIGVSRVDPAFPCQANRALLKVFADQAVIAIENVRLFNETKEALEQQTATAEILRVIPVPQRYAAGVRAIHADAVCAGAKAWPSYGVRRRRIAAARSFGPPRSR